MASQTSTTNTRPMTTFSGIFNPAMSSAAPTTAPQTQHQPFLMSGALPATADSTPQTIPWSPSYVSPTPISSRPTSVHKQLRRSKRTAAKKWAKRVARTLRNAISFGKERCSDTASFNHRSSMRSRLSFRRSKRMTRSFLPSTTACQDFAYQLPTVGSSAADVRSSVSIPSVLKTTPSGNRYTLHEHKGPGSEPAPTRRSVLIMHPATSAVMPEPPTPMSFTTVGSNDSWDEGDERHFSSSSSGGVSDCASSLDLTGQVNPRNMFAVSFLGTQMEGSTEAYQAFINNVDGFKAKLKARNILPTQPSGSETTKSSSALPFISKTPSLTSDDSSHRDSVASTESEREDNRAQALQALTGNATATTPFPDALQPGRSHRSIQGKPLASRPASAGGSALYFSFTDGFGPFNPYNEPQSPPPALQTADTAPPSSTRPSTPHFADTETHRKHYTAVESGLFDAYSSRPSTPTHFVDTATHREHYSRIESGIFDFATPSSSSSQSPPSCPANPTPDDRTPSFLLPASLHTSSSPSPSPSPSQVKPRPHQIKRKPVHAVNYSKPLDLNKPLPAVPSATHPKRFTNAKVPASFTTNGVVPAPLVMNENGFPIMARSKQQQQQPGRDSGVSRFGGAMHESRTVGAGEGKRAGETKQQRKVTELKGKTGLMTKAMGKLGF